MQIDHIFFDLDHTLWDFESNSNKTFSHIFQKNRLQVSLKDFLEVYRPINFAYWKLFREDKVSKPDLRYGRLKDSFDKIGADISDEVIELLSEEYIRYLADHNDLFEGALEILEYLQEKYTLHIITNGFDEVQHRKINQSGLSPFFRNIITSEAVGVKKPHPAIFEHALDTSGASAHSSMMIGDNYEADILGAKKVGMKTIFCQFNGELPKENEPTVTSLLQLKELL